MDAHRLVPDDVVSASKKLGRDDAVSLAAQCDTVIVSRGKKVITFEVSGSPGEDTVNAMLGPTGNLRAPLVRSARTLLVGFNREQYEAVLAQRPRPPAGPSRS